jgi:Replication-relaxation
MKTSQPPKPLLLTPRMEEILKVIYFYRFMTAVDVAYRVFRPGSLTHAREILTALSGGADYIERQYLYRFQLGGEKGNPERVYTLGSRGRDYLARDLGLPVAWYFRPNKVKHYSHAHVVHSLLVTRFLVAADWWGKSQPDIGLSAVRTSHELAETPGRVWLAGRGGKRNVVTVIPDAWLCFERPDGKRAPVLLEIDRGREHQQAFKQHVASRVEFIASGEYSRVFGTKSVTIAYATTGERPEYRASRLSAMCTWTKEILTQLGREDWSQVFRFTGIGLDEVYQTPLFAGPVWRRPDAETPVSLLTA